jgi:hypothetical protein
MSVPKNDILLAKQFDLRFRVVQKAGQGKPWETIEENIDLLADAIGKAQLLESWETGVFVEGTLYWSSHTPDVFNSTIIEHGKATIRKLASFELMWAVFLRVNSAPKARHVIHRISAVTGYEAEVLKCERYWKDQSLYRISFNFHLIATSIADAIFETLQVCQHMASHWTINTPSEHDDERWEFHGSAHKTSLVSVEMIDFHLSNYVPEWSGQVD